MTPSSVRLHACTEEDYISPCSDEGRGTRGGRRGRAGYSTTPDPTLWREEGSSRGTKAQEEYNLGGEEREIT